MPNGDMTQKEILQELYQVIIGISGNPDENGLIGDVREIKEQMLIINGRTRSNEVRSKVNQAMISGIIAIGGFFAGITKWVGWW